MSTLFSDDLFVHDVPCRRCGVNLPTAVSGGLNLCSRCSRAYGKIRRAGGIQSEADFLAWVRESP